jgi:hypothetical protein
MFYKAVPLALAAVLLVAAITARAWDRKIDRRAASSSMLGLAAFGATTTMIEMRSTMDLAAVCSVTR